MKLFNYVIEVDFTARQPITHMKVHRYNMYRHLVWGKLSVIFGQPHLEEIEVHKRCNGEIRLLGEDYISYCQDCETIVEGDTESITMEEYESRTS